MTWKMNFNKNKNGGVKQFPWKRTFNAFCDNSHFQNAIEISRKEAKCIP